MNKQFDELAKSLARSVTRRAALKKFGVGLAGMALACFGLTNLAQAAKRCSTNGNCRAGEVCCNGSCMDDGSVYCSPTNQCCCNRNKKGYWGTALAPCDPRYDYCVGVCSSLNPI
jgi:hypothetical protein